MKFESTGEVVDKGLLWQKGVSTLVVLSSLVKQLAQPRSDLLKERGQGFIMKIESTWKEHEALVDKDFNPFWYRPVQNKQLPHPGFNFGKKGRRVLL